MGKYIRVRGKYFCKRQSVRILQPGENFGKTGIVNCSQSLSSFYTKTGLIPVTKINSHNEESVSISPWYLQILDNKMKGGVIRMPRILKFALGLIFVLATWRLAYPLVDILIKFLSHLATR